MYRWKRALLLDRPAHSPCPTKSWACIFQYGSCSPAHRERPSSTGAIATGVVGGAVVLGSGWKGHAGDRDLQRSDGHMIAGALYALDHGLWRCNGRIADHGHLFAGETCGRAASPVYLFGTAFDGYGAVGAGHAHYRQSECNRAPSNKVSETIPILRSPDRCPPVGS